MVEQSHRVSLQPAFILHGRDFSNTSRLLDVFSRDFGRVSLIAKGARTARSKLNGILQPFTSLVVSWSGKGEVQTLTDAETVNNSIVLSGNQVISAYYINELIQRLMTVHDPHPELFDMYCNTLALFQKEDVEKVLRRFEKQLLTEIGYGLNLEAESRTGLPVSEQENYYYDIETGPVKVKNTTSIDEYIVSGKTLRDMSDDNYNCEKTRKEAKQLMRIILNHHLGDKPLKTRNLHWYKPL